MSQQKKVIALALRPLPDPTPHAPSRQKTPTPALKTPESSGGWEAVAPGPPLQVFGAILQELDSRYSSKTCFINYAAGSHDPWVHRTQSHQTGNCRKEKKRSGQTQTLWLGRSYLAKFIWGI